MQQVKKVCRVSPLQAIFMECDLQQKMAKHIKNFDACQHNAGRLAQVAKLLDIPVIATKQVNFGPIDERITAKHDTHVATFEKKTFSMLDEAVTAHMNSMSDRK